MKTEDIRLEVITVKMAFQSPREWEQEEKSVSDQASEHSHMQRLGRSSKDTNKE